MLPELKFNDKMMQALIDGRKTVTRRKEPKDICGGLYVAAICSTRPDRIMLKCVDSYPQKLSDMTEEDARKEGFESLEEFNQEISEIYGEDYLKSDPSMWVYEFVVIGKPAGSRNTN